MRKLLQEMAVIAFTYLTVMMQKLCVRLGHYRRVSRKHLLDVMRTALDEHAVWYDGNSNGILCEFLRRCVDT